MRTLRIILAHLVLLLFPISSVQSHRHINCTDSSPWIMEQFHALPISRQNQMMGIWAKFRPQVGRAAASPSPPDPLDQLVIQLEASEYQRSFTVDCSTNCWLVTRRWGATLANVQMPWQELAQDQRSIPDLPNPIHFNVTAVLVDRENGGVELCRAVSPLSVAYHFFFIDFDAVEQSNEALTLAINPGTDSLSVDEMGTYKAKLPFLPLRIMNTETGQSCPLDPYANASLVSPIAHQEGTYQRLMVHVKRSTSMFDCIGIDGSTATSQSEVEVVFLLENASGRIQLPRYIASHLVTTYPRSWIPYDTKSPHSRFELLDHNQLSVRLKVLDEYNSLKGVRYLEVIALRYEDQMPRGCDLCGSRVICCSRRIDSLFPANSTRISLSHQTIDWFQDQSLIGTTVTLPWLSNPSAEGAIPCKVAVDIIDSKGPSQIDVAAYQSRFLLHILNAYCHGT